MFDISYGSLKHTHAHAQKHAHAHAHTHKHTQRGDCTRDEEKCPGGSSTPTSCWRWQRDCRLICTCKGFHYLLKGTDQLRLPGSGRRACIEYCYVVSSWTRRGFLTNHCSRSEVSFLLGQCFYNYRLAAPNQTLHPITIFWVWLFFFFTCSSEDDFIEALVLSEPPPNATRPLWSHWNLWDRSDGSFSRWICGSSGLKY